MFDNGVITSKPGTGRFVGRTPYGFAYERIPLRDAARRLRETPVDRSGASTSTQSMTDKVKTLQTELDIANDQVKQLKQQITQTQKNV